MAQKVRCPICGSETIERTVVKGPDTGLRFHVCVRFPKCRGRVPFEEDAELSDIFDTDETEEKDGGVRDYNIAKTVSTTLKILAVIVWVIGLGSMIWVALNMHGIGLSASDMAVILLEYLLVVVVTGALVLAAGFIINIMIDIARNTSSTADFLAKKPKPD